MSKPCYLNSLQHSHGSIRTAATGLVIPEITAACRAAQAADQGAPTIFDKIISKQIPAKVIYEDETALAFRDINPQAPVHFLVIPKHRDGLTQLSKSEERHEQLLGHLLVVASKVAKQGVLLHARTCCVRPVWMDL